MAETHQVLWTDTARQDLTGIIDYIAQDSIGNALVILDKLEAKAALLATLPDRGRIVPELLDTGISHYRQITRGQQPARRIIRETMRLLHSLTLQMPIDIAASIP